MRGPTKSRRLIPGLILGAGASQVKYRRLNHEAERSAEGAGPMRCKIWGAGSMGKLWLPVILRHARACGRCTRATVRNDRSRDGVNDRARRKRVQRLADCALHGHFRWAQIQAGHDHRQHHRAAALLCAERNERAQIRDRRRPPGFSWAGMHKSQANANGRTGFARADAQAPARPAAIDEGRTGKPARRARDLSRFHALSHSRFERTGDDRPGGVLGMFRMTNEDVIDLYERVKVGSTVHVVLN